MSSCSQSQFRRPILTLPLWLSLELERLRVWTGSLAKKRGENPERSKHRGVWISGLQCLRKLRQPTVYSHPVWPSLLPNVSETCKCDGMLLLWSGYITQHSTLAHCKKRGTLLLGLKRWPCQRESYWGWPPVAESGLGLQPARKCWVSNSFSMLLVSACFNLPSWFS